MTTGRSTPTSTSHRNMRRNFLHWLTLAVVLSAACVLASAAAAKEAAHEFLDKLRERGYGEVALNELSTLYRTNAPKTAYFPSNTAVSDHRAKSVDRCTKVYESTLMGVSDTRSNQGTCGEQSDGRCYRD